MADGVVVLETLFYGVPYDVLWLVALALMVIVPVAMVDYRGVPFLRELVPNKMEQKHE